MSHFYGTIPQSARKTIPTARGHKKTGISVSAQSWQGKIEVCLWHDHKTGKDQFRVVRRPHGECTNQKDYNLLRGTLDMSSCVFDTENETAFGKFNKEGVYKVNR